jgi:hypothetical protein
VDAEKLVGVYNTRYEADNIRMQRCTSQSVVSWVGHPHNKDIVDVIDADSIPSSYDLVHIVDLRGSSKHIIKIRYHAKEGQIMKG